MFFLLFCIIISFCSLKNSIKMVDLLYVLQEKQNIKIVPFRKKNKKQPTT